MNRWVINRVGLLNFWYYKNQIFKLANGRMLLRGANGSGKSLTMQSLFPVLFDGDTSAYRLDSFGSRDRRMEDYLLGEKGVSDRDDGIGYLFLEVKRENREEYLTIGIGMHANRGGKLNKWFFAIENNNRIGIDVELYEELRKGELTPLTKQKLKNRLEGNGRLFDTQRDYKAYVNERIFGFEAIEQFDELIALLINLRSPKLSKEFRPSVIYSILRDSLPKLKDDDLLPLATTIERLDGHRERLEDLGNELSELKRFSKVYQKWHDELVGQLAGKWLAFSQNKAKTEKNLEQGRRATKKMQADLAEKETARAENETQLDALEKTIQELNQHEGMDLVRRGQELKDMLDDTIVQLTKTQADIDRKKKRLSEHHASLEKEQLQRDRHMKEMNTLLNDNEQYVSTLRFEELDAVYSTKMRNELTTQEFDYWKEQVQKKKQHFQQVIGLLNQLEQKQSQLTELAREVGDIQQVIDQLERDLRHWQQMRQQELENWKQAIDTWRKEARFELREQDYSQLLYQIDRLLEEEIREEIIMAPLRTSYEEAVGQNQKATNTLSSEQKEWKQLKADKEAEIKEWQAQKIPEIEQRETRKNNRQKWIETDRVLHFYKSVDFIEEIEDETRDRLEGALYASGILDSLISEEGLTLSDDLQILPQPKLLAVTLADFLTVNPELEQDLQPLVMDVLQSIIVGEADPELPAIFRDGSYQIANLRGQMPDHYQASYIGAASQERYRQIKIAQLETEIDEIDSEIDRLAVAIQAKEQLEREMKLSYENRPTGVEVYQAINYMSKTTIELQIRMDALKLKQGQFDALKATVNQETIELHRLTAQDELARELTAYQDANRSADYYEANLTDAYIKYTVIQEGKLTIDTLEQTIRDLQDEEDELLLVWSDLTSKKQSQQRSVDDNLTQQKLINIEELQIQLTQAREEQKQRKSFVKATNQAITQLVEQLAINRSQVQATEMDLENIRFEESHWRKLFDQEVHRFAASEQSLVELAREKQQQLSAKRLKDLSDQVLTQFNFIADQLQNYQPGLINVSGIDLSEEIEQKLGDFSQYNHSKQPHFKVNGESKTVFELQDQLTDQRMTLQDLLKKEDEQLFKTIILESVGNILRARIQQAMQWVEQMNRLLQLQKNSSGLSLSIQWKGLPSSSEQDLGTARLVELLQKPAEILSEMDREAISEHFQEKVRYAQEQVQEDLDGQSTLFQAVANVLDYRDWFEFELKYKRANEGYRPQVLTDRRFNQFSGGEKAIVMYLPLFAAVDSRYSDAESFCPKVITLDEAFAGIDDLNIAELFKACEQLGFNYVMNSQALFGDYPTVSKLRIYELLRPQNINIVTTISYYWDGQHRRIELGDVASGE
ncbi:TIGR02680 family protein [Amphibacillus indicireducens]|uniref:TIGR02680 family protein n=1 Tax=Amphibacillus indicireducens TaxID=1076330 RepID=A0ABP7V9L1_9BACI